MIAAFVGTAALMAAGFWAVLRASTVAGVLARYVGVLVLLVALAALVDAVS
jgi:hypothetical protein